MVNIDEITKNIYRIGVPLKGNPLKELNSYFIKGENFDLLIDTGFRTSECEAALREGLETLKSDPARRRVVVTHLHSDHAAMADIFAGEGKHVYMSRIDADPIIERFYDRTETMQKDTGNIYHSQGFTDEMLEYLEVSSPMRIYYMQHIDELNFHRMDDGDVIDLGDRKLQWILVPGHTPGNSMLWDEENKIMFTGDHILFDITPNITSWPNMDDALGSYLESLDKSLAYPVEIALPGHRKTGNYHERAKEIIKHHKIRLQEAYRIICENPNLTAMQIAGQMTWSIRAKNWEEFPLVQKWFAVGECQAHLDYMMRRNLITRYDDDGVWKYKANTSDYTF